MVAAAAAAAAAAASRFCRIDAILPEDRIPVDCPAELFCTATPPGGVAAAAGGAATAGADSFFLGTFVGIVYR